MNLVRLIRARTHEQTSHFRQIQVHFVFFIVSYCELDITKSSHCAPTYHFCHTEHELLHPRYPVARMAQFYHHIFTTSGERDTPRGKIRDTSLTTSCHHTRTLVSANIPLYLSPTLVWWTPGIQDSSTPDYLKLEVVIYGSEHHLYTLVDHRRRTRG